MRLLLLAACSSTSAAAALDDWRSATRSDDRHCGGRLQLVLLEQLLMLLMAQIDRSIGQRLAGECHPIVHIDEGRLLLLLMLGNDHTGIVVVAVVVGARLLLLLMVLLLLLLTGIDQFN